MGSYLAALALSVHVYDETGSGRWLAALLIADFLPIVLIGLALGPLVDRLSRKRLMIASDLVRAATFAVLPFVDEPTAIVAVAAVNGIATGFFRPAVYAGLPNLVSDRDLPQANGLLQTADNFTWAVGALVGGALVAATSPDAAYFVNAVSFVASAFLILRIRESLERPEEREPSHGRWRDIREGLDFALHSRALLTVLLAWSIVGFATAGINVAQVFLAKDAFSAGDFGYGLLVAAVAVGLVVGSLFGGTWIEQRGMAIP